MDKLIHFIDNVTAYITNVPPHSWYALGVTLASIPVVIGITQYVKNHHFKAKEQELASHFIALNLVFWSTLAASADFIVTNGTNFAPFLPFLHTQMPTLIAGASTVYALSKGIYGWFKSRQSVSSIDNVNKPDLEVVAATEASTTVTGKPSSSFGTASAGVDVVAPPNNIFS
jgi:hypothetical protein